MFILNERSNVLGGSLVVTIIVFTVAVVQAEPPDTKTVTTLFKKLDDDIVTPDPVTVAVLIESLWSIGVKSKI